MTPQQVIEHAGDDTFLRHMLFIRFVLGEPISDAGMMARHAEAAGITPPDVGEMWFVARHWHHDPPCPTCCLPSRSKGGETS